MLRSFADGRFFGERYGAKPATVLGLHGWGRTHSDMAPSVDGFDAISLDLPGFGASPPPEHGWTTEEYARALDPVLDDMARPIVIVAHSFGGRVAVHVAANRPASVAGLVLCGVPLLHKAAASTKPSIQFRAGRLMHKLGLISADRMDDLRDKHGSDDYKNSSGQMREVFVKAVNETYEAPMGKLTCPVELVWGDTDRAAPADIATRAETMLADARLTIVANADHWLPLTHPQPLRDAISRRVGGLGNAHSTSSDGQA